MWQGPTYRYQAFQGLQLQRYNEVKKMLGQRLEVSLKSQTLPRLDGHDEEGETLENQFEILSLANSCPDLTVLEIEGIADDPDETIKNFPDSLCGDVDVLDGILAKTKSVSNSSSFRRSTSLSSLGVDGNRRETSGVNTIDGNVTSVLHQGPVSKVVAHLDKVLLKKEASECKSASDFVRNALRASHGGATGYLHKSISSPSVTQYFVGVSGGAAETYNKSHLRAPVSDAHQHSTKRSFFRRKHKSKGNLASSQSAIGLQSSNKMDGYSSNLLSSSGGEPSFGLVALNDPSLRLQDPDAECWALSMSQDVVSRLDDKEVKRQEHIYELILTEKHHCLTLALMQHLFIGGMKKTGFRRYARLMFPELNRLLEVHFAFLRRLRERQLKFRELGQPMDSIADILVDQFSTNQWQLMIRLYGLLCASHTKSLDTFKSLLKDPKFASLVAAWDKEPLLQRKNVRECLLLVAQRITKYPLLFEPLLKTSTSIEEKEQISTALISSKELISKVNERVAERHRLLDVCQRIDPKSTVIIGQKRRNRDDIISVPARRLLFIGQAIVNCNRAVGSNAGAPGSVRNVPCTVLILTDSLVFTQEFSGKLHFVSPPGMVMLNNLIVRPNAGQTSSLFLVLGTGTSKPEMIELQVVSPLNRDLWMEKMRSAISKCEEETETYSDAEDESTDTSDYSDAKTSKALEELQEQDKQLLATLRSRAKVIDGLRSEKPHHWIHNSFEGRDGLLNSLSESCKEVQRVLSVWDAVANSSVNRSASCVGEYGVSGGLAGLPKRADTFGGFDSQQRSALELPQSANNKLLFDLVLQLSDLCGEMFSQMVPTLMPSVYQSHHQLQRRMEDLREAQQRLETEKALWQQELSSQKEQMERERSELSSLKTSLENQQKDIDQQREKLYRKLEALQKQGIRSPLEPISPLTLTTAAEKVPTNVVTSRRQVTQPPPLPPSIPTGNQQANGVKSTSKQKLPMHLAASSSFKQSNKTSSTPPGPENPPSLIRNSVLGSFKGSPSGNSISQISAQPTNDASRTNLNARPTTLVGAPRATSSQQVQQLLPYRLSEGSSNKTSSLPRGVGSRSVSSMLSQLDQTGHANSHLRTSMSTSHFPPSGSNVPGDTLAQPNSSFLYGPANNRAGKPHVHQNPPNSNGYPEFSGNPQENIAIVHRRSGSSPVPMSSAPVRRAAPPEIHYHQHPFFTPRDDDETKILFL